MYNKLMKLGKQLSEVLQQLYALEMDYKMEKLRSSSAMK